MISFIFQHQYLKHIQVTLWEVNWKIFCCEKNIAATKQKIRPLRYCTSTPGKRKASDILTEKFKEEEYKCRHLKQVLIQLERRYREMNQHQPNVGLTPERISKLRLFSSQTFIN